MKKKKICFIVSSPFTAKVFLAEHIEVLSRNFDVYVIANFENEEQKNISKYLTGVFDIKIHRNISILKDLNALIKLVKILKLNSFDAIHSVTPKAGLIAMLGGKLASTKVRIHIFTGQVWHTKRGFMKWLLKTLDKLVVLLATHILVDGQAQRSFLIANKIIGEQNSQVLGKGSISGVNTDRFIPETLVRQKLRQELGYKDTDVVFIFLGRLNRDKGILDLAQAFKLLQEELPYAKLLFIGIDEEKLIPEVLSIVGETNFKFYGSTSAPERVLQTGDVLCLPSYREGFGTSIIEGALLELPVICSDTYGLKETIIENKTGLRHKVKDVTGIYHQMKKMTQDENLRLQMGKAGRSYVLENFKASQISEQWLLYYKKLLL